MSIVHFMFFNTMSINKYLLVDYTTTKLLLLYNSFKHPLIDVGGREHHSLISNIGPIREKER
jgi:hypothetical protein